MAQNISQQVLEDFTATITKNPNVSRQKILEAFPEFNNDSALLDAAYDYAETRRMNPYEDIQTINSKFPEFFGGAVEQPAQSAEQPKQPSLLQSIGAHNPYPIQPANPLKAETWDIDKQNRERLERIKSATLPMSDEDKQREAEIERLGKEGAFGTPNGISITYDKRTGSPIITRTESDGAHLYTGVNANQSEIDRLINERPDYMRTPHSEEDIVDNIERAWMTNTENGQKAIADAEQRIKDFIASCQENFKYTQQVQQITQALQSGQIDEQQAQQYADSAFNELYGEVIMQHVQEEKDAFKQAALADNQDYYLKAKRDLQYAATHKVTADAHKQIDNLLKNESEPSVMQLAHSGGQMMRDPYIHAAQNFLYKAEQRMNDMRLDKYEAGDFAKNVAYDLGGILESTATFGLSDLADRSTVTSIFKKVADAASKAKDPDEIYNNPELVLNDKERAVYTAYTAMISAEMARSLDTSYWADAAKLTADMIPFMLEVGAMNGIFGGINRAAQEGISRGLTRSIVGKLPAGAKKTAAKMFTGAITNIAGAGLYAGESAVMSLALPRTYANMLQKEIDVDYNALNVDNDNLVIGGFDTKSTPEAFMNAWRDQWKEMFTETGGLFNVGANVLFNNPIAKRAFYGIKRSNLGGLIDMFNTGKFFDFAKQVGYHGTYKEWLEEVEGTCWDYAFGDKDAFANFFSRDTQIPMLISFTVPAVLGGGINAGREIKYRMQFKNATNNILNTIKSHGFTDEDFADIKKSLYATPVEDLPATIANMAAALTETEQFGNMYKDYAFYSNKAKYGKLSPEEQQRLDVAAAYLFDSNNAQTEEAKALAAELTKLAYAEVALSAFDKDIANDRRRAYNEAVSFYREQTADIAQKEQAQEQSAPTPYEQIVQDVTRTVNNLAFRNGGELTDDTPVFRVSLSGQEGKQGYIVSGESLPELDATGKMFTNNPLMTIKWDDDTVTQHTLNELVLLGVSTAGQRIAQEVEARNDERAVEKIADGEKPVIMTRGNEVLVLFRKGNGILVDEHDQEYVDTQLFQDGWKLTEDQEERHPNDESGVTPMKPTVPNIDTMSADEYVRAIVEDRYKGNRTKAQAIISAKLNGAKTDLQVTQKEFDKFQKKGLTSSMNEEQWEAQYDKYEQQIKGLTALVSKLEAANIAVVHYKTQAELQEEAERKAREAAMREQRRQLAEAEAAGDIEAKWQNTKKTVGFAATKTLPNGQKVNGHYILTEAGDVVPSHDPRKNYADSEGYVMENGQNVNDNNYKDPDVQRIALDIAQNYGGQAVEQMPFLENRAGRVLSGNNRTISGIIAAENNTDQAYLAALTENAQQYGFTPEQLAEYQHPRLQFVVEDELPFTTATFAMFNQQEKKTKSSVNRAVANSKMVTEAVRDKMLEIMDQYESLDSFFGSESAASDIVQTLITEGLMTQQEVPGLTETTDKGFKFNQSGKEYVTDMLLGTLFDEKTIRMLAGEKTLKQAILRALPSIVANRRLKGYELTDSINNAIQLLYEARKANEGKSTADAFTLYLRQVDAFEGSVKDRYSGFDIILANRMSAGVEQLREILGLYNNSAMNEANGQMGFFEPRTINDIKQDVYEYYTKQQPELAAALNGAAARGSQPESAVPSGAADAPETRQPSAGEQALEAAAEAEQLQHSVPQRPNSKMLQGMNYTVAEAEDYIGRIVRNILDENGYEDVEIVGTKVIGSRVNGDARADSDLDAIVEFKGNAREDSLFNLLHEQPIEIDGVPVDINPITEGKSGTIEQFMRRADEYLAEKEAAKAEREEFISLVNQYLTSISSKETKGVLFDNNSMISLFRELGFPEEMIQAIEEAQNEGDEVQVRGFNHNGVVFLNVDAISTPEDARNNYVHERQHSLTLADSHWVGEVMNATSEEELTDLLNKHTKNHYYDNKKFVEKADEFISYAMEIAYSVATNEELERALKDMGANDALINIIKSINDEQRKDNDLSLARRTPFVDGRDGGDSQQNGGDRGTRAETGLEPEGAGSAESGTRGTEGGAEQITASDEWLNSELGKNYQELRKLYPQHIPVLRVGGEYHLYGDEAIAAGRVLGIEPTSRRGTSFISFPHKELDKALPKLIRAGHRVVIVSDMEKPETAETPTDNRETSETRATETEIGGALVDRLGDMGVSVSTDLDANRAALKAAKADKSDAGAIHYYKTPSGQQYGFSYKGRIYLDPTKIDAELPIHEYGHLWAEAMRRISLESWRSVVDTIKADQASWDFVRELRPELTDENEIAEEVIATFSGKRGAERLRAEYKKMHGKDADYKSKWGNIFQNISKAIQDFWKAVGDFLNIKYQSAEQIYDQVLKDFVDNMNPYQKVRDFLRARDAEYIQAAESGDIQKATNIFYDALRENIGNGITPYMSVGTYNDLKRLAKGVKTRDAALIKEAADLIAPLIPDNAVLIPAPSHSGTATDMLDLAKAIAEVTGSEVADVLRSAPRESQYQAKKTTGVPMASKQLGIAVEGEIPADKTPIIIDNVVDSGNTAEACVQAVGKGVVVTLADSAEQYGHAASLKSAAPILRDKDGNIVPLTKRFNLNGSRYLGRRMYLRPNDPRFAISGTQVIPVTDKTLVGLHNISAEKLRKALKAGGLANPSAAVIDIARQNHHDYGDVSLVLSSNMVENSDGTYAGDAWTPMYPQVEYRQGKQTEKRIKALVKGLPKNLADGIYYRVGEYMDRNRNSSGLEYLFLKNKGEEMPILTNKRRYPDISIEDIYKRLGMEYPGYYDSSSFQAYEQLPEDQLFEFNLWLEKYGREVDIQRVKDKIAELREKGENKAADVLTERYSQPLFFNYYDSIGYRILRDERDAGEENIGETLDAADRKIDELGLRNEFEDWKQQMIDSFGYDEVLFAGWTSDGDRRYVKNTVENASRLMNKESETNYLDRQSVNETKAMLMDKLRTLSDIRKHKGQLEPDDEKIREAYEQASNDWGQLGIDFRDYTTNEDKTAYGLDDNPFTAIDTALARLQEAMFKRDPIAFLNREYRYSLPADSEFGTRLKEMVKRIKNLPSRYFETKFRRPVYLNEFANAVVPNDLPQDLRAGLESAGLRLFSYDPAEQGSRRAATLKATADEGIRFSISSAKGSPSVARRGNLQYSEGVLPSVAKEMESIKNNAINNGTFMQAPNGKRSNLNERQWLQVRTRAFKRWFGDWENDPQNASKVLDENGEPMVLTHRTWSDFTTFDKDKIGSSTDVGSFGQGFYFSKLDQILYGKYRIDGFLNIKTPMSLNDKNGHSIKMRYVEDDAFDLAASKRMTDDLIKRGYDGVIYENPYYMEVVAFEPNQIKSATDNDGSFSEENDDIRFSISNQNNDIFYSNAERAVEGIKQEKATPEQWRAMIEKAGGLKAGEDKWIGLSDWLAQQRPTVTPQANETRSQFVERAAAENKRFTLSKQDLLDYIREHKIQIEEQEYGEYEEDVLFLERKDEFKRYYDEAVEAGEEDPNEVAWDRMIEEYGDDFSLGYYAVGDELMRDNDSDYAQWEADSEGRPRNINETRLRYTTWGLENKREIALIVPDIEEWNEDDEIHFGDAGEGRAIAWVRFGDAHKIKYGENGEELADVLVIDEIQSKRHQEGREHGYIEKSADKAMTDYTNMLYRKYGVQFNVKMSDEERIEYRRLQREREFERQDNLSRPTPAPFEKNWHELAMKRILRFAAENGYDKVAWTTGDQQAERYNIGKVVDLIEFSDWIPANEEENDYGVDYRKVVIRPRNQMDMWYYVDRNGNLINQDEGDPNTLAELVGKDLARNIVESSIGNQIGGEGLRIGGEGMRGFYDDILPRFMQKYGKKWGVQVGEVTMPDLEEGYQTMHAIDINDAMRESVMEGQPMFSISGRGVNGTIKPQEGETRSQYIARVAETVKNMTPRNTTIDDAIRFSITVNHNSPYLLKRADGAFVDPETGERLGFDHRFMGKGEGGQAHGWGSYFSVNDLRNYGEGYGFSLRDIRDAFNTSRWQSFGVGDAFDVAKGYLLEAHSEKAPSLRKWLEDRLAQKQELLKNYEGKVANTAEEGLMVFRAEADVQYIPALLRDMVNDIDTRNRHHYTVEIPDNDGTNYLDEIKTLPKPLRRKIAAAVRELPGKPMPSVKYVNYTGGWRQLADMIERNQWAYMEIRDRLVQAFGSKLTDEKRLSDMMHDIGFVGIHYDGRRDGECYVIFDENDAVITDHIRFSVSGRGREPQRREGNDRTWKTVAEVDKELREDGYSDESPVRFSIAYHGTGADFDKFLKSKINTGEGSQAFGWGLYFTDAKEIAEDYAKRQARQPKNAKEAYMGDQKLNPVAPETDYDCLAWVLDMNELRNIRTMNPDVARSIVKNTIALKSQELRDRIKFYEGNGATRMVESAREELEYYRRAGELVREIGIPNIEFRGDRNLYTVSIPEDNGMNYFEWNAEIDDRLKSSIIDGIVRRMEQMPEYGNTPGYAARIVPEFMQPYHVGGVVYLVGTRWLPKEEMSEVLAELGYKGIKYDAGTNFSQGVPDGAKNYVVFDDKDIEITDHIRFSVSNPSTLSRSETVTKALVQQANNNYNIMQSALKKVTADLKGIRAAMRMQSDYDRKVVDSLLNLYNTLLQENGVWAQYMPDTTRRIATQIVHAIGKQNITEEVNTIMDHMVHAQAKAAQRQWDKLRQTPIDKINISGVVMQGKVALEGQHALKAMNDALQANMTIEQIEEQINQLMDMEDNATDESLKTQYKGQWIGLTIAEQHLERLQHLQEERQQLNLELQSARSNKALKPAARQQLVDNIKQAMRDNYIEQAEAYTRSTQDLSEYVNTQEGRAKDFIRRQDANRDKIRSYAQRDLEGLATNPNRNRTKGNVARSIWDAFASPIRDLQSLLRLTGLHAPDGEGYLYNHFMRNWMDGADKERTGIVAASKTLDEKIAELTHGKYKTWEEAARKINDASHNMFTITMLNGVDGKDMPVEEEIPLNAGNALYIYAVNKMNDGRMKLNGMNISEEDVQALADKVREQFGQEILDVVDWVQSEFFSQLRNRYNPTHEALFGAPMDAIENYFPLRINANARQQNEDLSEPDTDAARLLAGTSTGAIKRRTKNSLPLDVRNADFFQEVIRHISQMERWNAFAQWNRDANILFSDINFRNRIKGMKGTIYGEGDKLYNYLKDAFRVAIGTYKPKTDTFSEITLNMAKGVTSAKINFRIFTALKQIASFPAFFTYMQDGVFVGSYLRNWLKPHETMKWAKENLPNFEKRVSKRDMGDMRLMQRSTDWQWNKRILKWSSKYGMFFNVFFDTLTCATGARAVYDSHLADYLKKGYSEEDARNRARQDAEQAFNTSQQSSEGAFMSAVQQDRNLVTAALTVFRTSPIQYTRNFFYHTRNLLRKFGEGKRDEQIAFRMGQYKNDGLTDEQARKAAEKDYNKSLRQDIVGFVVYGALLNILWRLVGQVPYLLRGDDDDKKKQILEDAITGGAFVSPITGLLGGGIVESALDGNGSVADMFAPEMPFTQDIKRAGQYLSNDKYAEFASQALSVLMQSGTGFDPLTASDMISRAVTTLDSEEDLDVATQYLRVKWAILSIPQSQYEQKLIDKVVSGETDEDAALEDYIRYRKIHTAPLTWWLRGEESDEKAEENAEKRFNKLLTERDKIKNPEDYEE